jgi:hypothetical protein
MFLTTILLAFAALLKATVAFDIAVLDETPNSITVLLPQCLTAFDTESYTFFKTELLPTEHLFKEYSLGALGQAPISELIRQLKQARKDNYISIEEFSSDAKLQLTARSSMSNAVVDIQKMGATLQNSEVYEIVDRIRDKMSFIEVFKEPLSLQLLKEAIDAPLKLTSLGSRVRVELQDPIEREVGSKSWEGLLVSSTTTFDLVFKEWSLGLPCQLSSNDLIKILNKLKLSGEISSLHHSAWFSNPVLKLNYRIEIIKALQTIKAARHSYTAKECFSVLVCFTIFNNTRSGGKEEIE